MTGVFEQAAKLFVRAGQEPCTRAPSCSIPEERFCDSPIFVSTYIHRQLDVTTGGHADPPDDYHQRAGSTMKAGPCTR